MDSDYNEIICLNCEKEIDKNENECICDNILCKECSEDHETYFCDECNMERCDNEVDECVCELCSYVICWNCEYRLESFKEKYCKQKKDFHDICKNVGKTLMILIVLFAKIIKDKNLSLRFRHNFV